MSNGGIVLQKREGRLSGIPSDSLTGLTFSRRGRPRAAYVVVAHCVDVVLQVTFAVIGQDNATQFAIAGKVETSIGGENQQTGHIPPTDLVLRSQRGIHSTRNANRDIALWLNVSHEHRLNVGAVFSKATAVAECCLPHTQPLA